MHTATFIRIDTTHVYNGRIYRVDPPVSDRVGGTTDHVLVSAIVNPVETLIFACDASGHPASSRRELYPPLRDSVRHTEALENAGYTVH